MKKTTDKNLAKEFADISIREVQPRNRKSTLLPILKSVVLAILLMPTPGDIRTGGGKKALW